jgi:hypothetical protein
MDLDDAGRESVLLYVFVQKMSKKMLGVSEGYKNRKAMLVNPIYKREA